MARLTPALLLPVVSLMLLPLGCKEAKRTEKQLTQLSQTYVVQPAKSYYDSSVRPAFTSGFDQLGEAQKSATETKDTLTEIKDTLTEVKESVAEAKQTAKETKEAVAGSLNEAEETATRSVYNVVRKAPRSEKEANEMVVEKGRSFFEWVRSHFQGFARNHNLGFKPKRSPRSGTKPRTLEGRKSHS